MRGQRCQEGACETTPLGPTTMLEPPAPDEPAPHRFEGAGALERALALVRFLRAGCDWDRVQTAESLIPHLLEEAHEVADAIQAGDAQALEGELGDLLLNLAFQIVVAAESDALDEDSVYRRLESKMVARHPHLFGAGAAPTGWEALKASERGDEEGVLSGLARSIDPLTKAHRIQERVASVGFDWEDHEGALAKVAEELGEATEALASRCAEDVEEELGDLLFAVVNVARLAGTHATTALGRANRKFHERFEQVERLARERGIDLHAADLDTLDALWEEVKAG
jgi:MazG family protein